MVDRSTTNAQPRPAGPPGHRRLLRRVLKCLLALVFLAALSLWTVTRSWFIIWQVRPELELTLGGDLRIGSAAYMGDGAFVFGDLKLRARGIHGIAGEVMTIERATVVVDPGKMWTGRIEVKDVQLDQLLLRAAEASHDPNSFAFMALEPDWSGERGKSMLPPRVGITSAVIELGVYDGANYQVVGTRRVAGRMSPAPGEDAWFDFKLLEIDQTNHSMGDRGVVVQGRWNVRTLEHSARVDGIQLDRTAYDMCPQIVKLWWDQMDPQGRVASATIHWKPDGPFTAEVEIESLALTLPVQTDQVWTRYVHGRIEPSTGRPRMSVNGGTIRLEGDTLFLDDLQGELASSDETQTLAHVPYHVSLRVDSLPDIDWHNKQQWMQAVLTNAAFQMDLRMDDFSLEPGADGGDSAIELPTPVAQGLAKFQLTGWSMNSDVTVTRDPPLIDDDGAVHQQPIRMTGHASIRDAFGKYFKFPYALEEVAAGIEFSNDEILIEELTGRGASGAQVRITGRIAPLATESAVSLHVAATGVPLDEHLRAALPTDSQQAFDKLLDRAAFEERARSGVIVDDAAIEEIRRTRDGLFAELVALPEPDDKDDEQLARRRSQLEQRLERLERIIDTGPFHLGGVIDLDLDVDRAAGDDQDTITTGKVRIRRAGIVPAMFPYPLQVLSGMLDWKADRVDIIPDEQGDGLRIATPGGGLGTITGRIELPTIDGRVRARPELKFDVRGDHPNELLYAAIPDFQTAAAAAPGAKAQEPPRMSRGGALLKSLGLDASVQYTGSFRESDDGKPQYDVSVLMREGTAAPTESLSEAIGKAGLLWPPGGTLREAAGELRITPDALELVNLVASHDGGRLEATGRVDLRCEPVQTALNVRLGGLTLDHYLLNLLPQENLDRARALWDRYQPHGTFDAQLEYSARGADDSDVKLSVFPTDLSVTLNGEAITLSRIDGTLAIEDGRVVFDDLALGISGANHHDGIVTLAGSYGIAGAGEGLRVDGRWEGARLESPLIIEALRTIGAEEHATGYASLDPVGRFNATFSYQSPHDDVPRQYEFAAELRTAAFTISGVRINAELDEGARVTLKPGLAALQHLTGQYEAGDFAITGTVGTEPRLWADLRVSHRGQVNEQFLALLPEEAAVPIRSIQLEAGQQLHVDDATLRLSRLDPAGPGEKARWVVLFDGPVRTHGMSLDAGLKITQANGVFHIHAQRSPEGRTTLAIDADMVRALVAGREVTNARAMIELSPDGTELLIPQMRADCYGGALAAQARLGLGDHAPYSVEMELVAVGLEGFSVGDDAPEPGLGAQKPADRGDPPSGEMFGKFTLAGLRGLSETRRGYCELRVVRGRMTNMPLTLRIVQLLALMLPITDSLDFADVGFYMQGDRAVFERFFLAGPTIALVGDEGQMNLDTFDLNLRFRPRGTLPVMSDLVGGVSDQFFIIEVTGPLNDPQAGIITLPGMKRTPVMGNDAGARTNAAQSSGSIPLAAAGMK